MLLDALRDAGYVPTGFSRADLALQALAGGQVRAERESYLETALAKSLNRATVRLGLQVGVRQLIETAHAMAWRIRSRLALHALGCSGCAAD